MPTTPAYTTQPPCKNCPYLSHIRILHASPDAPPVDVYANNKLIASNVRFKEFTPYVPIAEGNYNIKVFPTGSMNNPVINTNISVPGRLIATIAAIGQLANITLLTVPEPVKPINPGKSFVRFVHLSPNTPAVDITLPDGTKLFSNISFKQITEYKEVSPGTYILQARPAGSKTVALNIPNINIKPNRFYTVYAVGLLNGNPPLQVLIPLDGNTYIKQ